MVIRGIGREEKRKNKMTTVTTTFVTPLLPLQAFRLDLVQTEAGEFLSFHLTGLLIPEVVTERLWTVLVFHVSQRRAVWQNWLKVYRT
jgi:hypothetical protein